ncbi:hypothetical protein B0F90DRAFT_398184 [Multifurca ochricompacta]|uniref:FHA domain-containing protein n=1 Tax=Multifurca ochricompacta TaxID=376703 RepID=A0AAD4M5X9_9AGAM|nr:hypothetical protein B0F90DRAFT_398184 [Multifurca ochricompacta]
MWIVTGPFDGELSNEVGFQKSKVLKSGKSYTIGRKSNCDIVVNHKKVSHDHGQFIVGGFSPDDVTSTNYTPTLRILNSKNKTMRIFRQGFADEVIVNPGATEQLQHDDKLDIVSGLPLMVHWQRLCCFETPGRVRAPVPIDGLASLGVHVVRTHHPDITHHLIPSYALTPAHMTSLLSAVQLVKPEWLSELLELSILDPRESTRALEHTFVLPLESKFRPAFAVALPLNLKSVKTWEPNEARLNMLKGYRFVFAGEKGLEVPAGYRELVKRGGAEYEVFTVSAGVVRWRKALLRAKALSEEKNSKVVIVADGGVMELALGVEDWEEFVSVAKSLELEIILPENILQAVAYVDTFYVDSARPPDSQGQGSRETPLPDVGPNTLPGGPSIALPIPTPPERNTFNPSHPTSELPPPAVTSLSGQAIHEPAIPEVHIPRRLPLRRATDRTRATALLGPGSDAVLVDTLHAPSPPPASTPGDAAPVASQLPTPMSQARKPPPRRRANLGIDPSSALLSTGSNPQPPPSQFSQLDKYKALFDASHPNHASSETQPETGTVTQDVRAGMLSAVPEEEESQGQGQSQNGGIRGTKRRRAVCDEDTEMADVAADTGVNADSTEGTHRGKRRAMDTDAVQHPTQTKPSSASTQTRKPGAEAIAATTTLTEGTKQTPKPPTSSKSSTNNKLDTDENFLRAVNSMKRGKKLEDEFDREFNQLRITKPKTAEMISDGGGSGGGTDVAMEVVAPWDAIDDFGDAGVRGNFMIIMDMDFERGSAKPVPPVGTYDSAHPEWVGRPNFKKFKSKKSALCNERRPFIELVPSEENDYGIGTAYWRSGASGSQSHSESHGVTAAHPPLPRSESNPPFVSKTPRADNTRGGRGRRAPPAQAANDEEGEVFDLDDVDDDEMEEDSTAPVPMPPPRSTRNKAGGRAKTPAASATKPSSKTKTMTAVGKLTTRAKLKATKGKEKEEKKASNARTTKGKKPAALFLSDDEDEDEVAGGIMELDDSDDGDSEEDQALSMGKRVGTLGLGVNDPFEEGVGERGRDEDEDEEAGMTSTLRSTAGTQLLQREAAVRATKRRAAAVSRGDPDDDSDDAVFKGFESRKRGRVR